MIKDCEIQKVETCHKSDSIIDVAKKIRDTHQRHIFVVDDSGKPVGIVSTVDISNKIVAEGKNLSKITAKDVMNSPVEYVDADKDEEFALKIMMEKNTFTCPVVQGNKLIGIVSYNEIFKKVSDKLRGRG